MTAPKEFDFFNTGPGKVVLAHMEKTIGALPGTACHDVGNLAHREGQRWLLQLIKGWAEQAKGQKNAT